MKIISFFAKRCFLTMILLSSGILSFAQNSDWSLWTSMEAEKKLSKKWDLGVEAQYRLKDNMSVTDQIRIGADISRKLGDYVKLGAGYELIAKHKIKQDNYVYRNRFRVQATGSYKYARFTASWRTRMQLTLMETEAPRGDIFEDDSYKWVWRNRFGLKYDIKKTPLKPYANVELFQHLFSGSEPGYYKNRFSIGTEYKLNKRHSLEAGYILETEVDTKKKYSNNVFKVGYVFSF